MKWLYEMAMSRGVWVALFTRAWIEIFCDCKADDFCDVALFTRAWIEIEIFEKLNSHLVGRPLHEGVD